MLQDFMACFLNKKGQITKWKCCQRISHFAQRFSHWHQRFLGRLAQPSVQPLLLRCGNTVCGMEHTCSLYIPPGGNRIAIWIGWNNKILFEINPAKDSSNHLTSYVNGTREWERDGEGVWKPSCWFLVTRKTEANKQ